MDLPGKFTVNAMGAANYAVPVVVPPGSAGMAPSLSLAYSSQGSNGIVGLGWTLDGLPSIGRCQRTFAQDGVLGTINYDADDRFCLDGQRLVAVSGAYGADSTQYRTEIESFARVVSRGTAGNGPAWFEVRTKAGQIMEFGNTTDSRILAQGKTTARSWALNKVSDTKGNFFTVGYVNDTTNGEAYPSRIDYTGNAAAGVAPYNSVRFVYASRPDVTSFYRAGSLMRTTVRLTNVQTFAGDTRIGDYRLAYQQGSATGHSLLASVTLCDRTTACLPATAFAYKDFALSYPQFAAAADWGVGAFGNGLPGWLDQVINSRMVLDVNGDGKADVAGFSIDGVWVALSTGAGFATASRWIPYFGTSVAAGSWSDFNTYPRMFADVNGDGLPDIVGFASTGVFVSLNTRTGFAPQQLWIAAYGTQAGGWSDAETYPRFLADVDGDGKADIVGFASNGVIVALSTGSGFATPQYWSTAYGTNAGWSGNNTHPRVLADVNGDGKADVVGFSTIGVFVSFSTGTSFTTPQLLISGQYGINAGGWSDNATYPRLLVDVNGDGLSDIVGFASDGVHVAISTGSGFTTPQKWIGDYGSTAAAGGWTNFDTYPRFLADVNGDGLPDIVGFASNGVHASIGTGAGFSARQPWGAGFGTLAGGWTNNTTYPRFLADVDGDGRADVVGFSSVNVQVSTAASPGAPNLLSTITSGLGAVTTISYAPLTSSSVYVRDSNATYPKQDVQAAVNAVSRVEAPDGIGGIYSLTYSYAGAKADVSGRGFLGFRQMKVTDLQTNIVETTNYRQDFPLIAAVDSTVKALGTQTLNQAANAYQLLNAANTAILSWPSTASAPYRVSVVQTAASSVDLDGSVFPAVTTNYQYDPFGNATQIVVATADGSSKTTVNTYTNDTTNWLLGRLGTATVTSQIPPASGQYCGLPWGGMLSNGQSVTAYAANKPSVGQTCASIAQTRTCSSGSLSGSYTFQACGAPDALGIMISSSTNNFELWSYLVARGLATPGTPGSWVVTVGSGVVVGSTSASVPAFSTGTPPAGSTVQLVNNGTIVGAGGNGGAGGLCLFTGTPGTAGSGGGTALRAQIALTVVNNGAIWGGGGGGGGGSGQIADGGGGGGAGSIPGSGGAAGVFGTAVAGAGSAGTISSGGSGGAGASAGGTAGGAGGGPGLPGSGGGSNTASCGASAAGGPAGAAVVGNSLITWTAVGDRRGPLN